MPDHRAAQWRARWPAAHPQVDFGLGDETTWLKCAQIPCLYARFTLTTIAPRHVIPVHPNYIQGGTLTTWVPTNTAEACRDYKLYCGGMRFAFYVPGNPFLDARITVRLITGVPATLATTEPTYPRDLPEIVLNISHGGWFYWTVPYQWPSMMYYLDNPGDRANATTPCLLFTLDSLTVSGNQTPPLYFLCYAAADTDFKCAVRDLRPLTLPALRRKKSVGQGGDPDLIFKKPLTPFQGGPSDNRKVVLSGYTPDLIDSYYEAIKAPWIAGIWTQTVDTSFTATLELDENGGTFTTNQVGWAEATLSTTPFQFVQHTFLYRVPLFRVWLYVTGKDANVTTWLHSWQSITNTDTFGQDRNARFTDTRYMPVTGASTMYRSLAPYLDMWAPQDEPCKFQFRFDLQDQTSGSMKIHFLIAADDAYQPFFRVGLCHLAAIAEQESDDDYVAVAPYYSGTQRRAVAGARKVACK